MVTRRNVKVRQYAPAVAARLSRMTSLIHVLTVLLLVLNFGANLQCAPLDRNGECRMTEKQALHQ